MASPSLLAVTGGGLCPQGAAQPEASLLGGPATSLMEGRMFQVQLPKGPREPWPVLLAGLGQGAERACGAQVRWSKLYPLPLKFRDYFMLAVDMLNQTAYLFPETLNS